MAARGSGEATRRGVLSAAAELVLQDGASRLTLDAVAERVGLSKGGLLHHFGTKDSLIAAMIEDAVREFESDLQRNVAREQGPGSFARAFLRACLDRDGIVSRTIKIGGAVLAAVAINRQLLVPLRTHYVAWLARLDDDGIDPAIAALVRSAADGLWLGNAFELGPTSRASRERGFAMLIELTRGRAPEPAPFG